MKKKIMVIFFSVLSMSIFAEKINFNLEKAIQTAENKNKNIKKSEITLKNYKLQKNEAFKSALPKLEYSGTYGKMENTPEGDTYNKYLLSLVQPVFNGFQIMTAIENSDKYVNLGELSLENIKNEVSLNVTKIYVDIEKYKKQLVVLKNSKKVLEENYKRVQRLYELGLVTKTEVLDIKYSMIDVETSIIQLENSIETNKINLKNSLGINIEQKIEIEPIENTQVDVMAIDVDKDINQAKSGNITMKMQKINTELKKASEVTDRAKLMPSVNLTANYGNLNSIMGDVGDAFKDENMSWSVGVTVSGTLFAWGKNKDAYARAKNETTKAEYEEKIASENVELNVKSAYLELIRLEKSKEASKEALKSSKENFRLQEKSYENQLITSTDFLDAENDLRKAEINLIEIELDLYYAYQNYLTLIK